MSWYFRQVMGQRSTQLGKFCLHQSQEWSLVWERVMEPHKEEELREQECLVKGGRERECKGKGLSGEIKDEERPGELKQMKLHTFPLLVSFDFAQCWPLRLTTGPRKWVVQA